MIALMLLMSEFFYQHLSKYRLELITAERYVLRIWSHLLKESLMENKIFVQWFTMVSFLDISITAINILNIIINPICSGALTGRLI